MAASATSSLAEQLRQRADALPLDRAPLRRAGLMTLLLIGLLVVGKAFSAAPARSADRQEVRPTTEEVSAPHSTPAWTGGRVLAILFLATGGGIAFWMHRRAGDRTVSHGSTLRALETHTLGPGQSLRLVACGEEVLLLSVTSEGVTLLRHWPRESFETTPASFARTLASAAADPPTTSSTLPPSDAPCTDLPLPTGEGRGEESHMLELASNREPPARADESESPSLGRGDSASRCADTTALASSTDSASDERRVAPRLGYAGLSARGDDSLDKIEEGVVVELATQTIAEPTIARGTLFPPRAGAPHQFDVRHG